MTASRETVRAVVEKGLCMGCGTCLSVCKAGAVSLRESPEGLLLAEVNADKCTSCGLCARVCPGSHLERGLLSDDTDPFRGSIHGTWYGHATDEAVRADGQSGGVTTALLKHLLESRLIDRALVTVMPADGSLRPRPVLAESVDEILAARGSKYCPVPLNQCLAQVRPDEKIAVVGLGCQMQGLQNLIALRPTLRDNVACTFGLLCNHVLTYHAMRYLIEKAGVRPENAAGFEFRNQRWRGWPGDVLVTTRDGSHSYLPREFRLRANDTFTPARCRLCFDKFNYFSDVVVGDAYRVDENPRGDSIIIAHTAAGRELLQHAEERGLLDLKHLDTERFFAVQGVELRRTIWTVCTRVWREHGRECPDFGIAQKWHADVTEADVTAYRELIEWPLRLAQCDTAEAAYKAARAHLAARRRAELFWKISPLRYAKAILRRIRRVLLKLRGANTQARTERTPPPARKQR